MNDVRYLNDAIDRLAHTEHLLVACDFDGTLAPIVDNPAEVVPHRASVNSLQTLAAMPDTHVVVISGRALDDLADHLGPHLNIHRVGSHGAESSSMEPHHLSTDEASLRLELNATLREVAAKYPGASIEEKPLGAAFHVRNVSVDDQNAAMVEVLDGPGQLPGVFVTLGKMVAELSVVQTDKGTALREMKDALGCTGMLFVGDDVTDENGFRVMELPDVSVKVGIGPTAASFSVSDVDDVATLLAQLSESRALWTGTDHAEPIQEHSLLSDLKTLAIVEHDATVSWMGAPHADSPSVFSKLLGTSDHGRFSIRPRSNAAPIRQRYLTDALVLETEWEGLSVVDFFHLESATAVTSQDVTSSRLLRIIEGRIPIVISFVPRPHYAEHRATIKLTDHGAELHDGSTHIRLTGSGVTWRITQGPGGDSLHGEADLDGRPLHLELQISESKRFPKPLANPGRALDETLNAWRSWIDQLHFPTLANALVRRSALLLKGLCHRPSGAVLAAATTSLPEDIGGTRNWDYRMCWPRDGSMAMSALVSLGSLTEADAFLEWLADRVTSLGGPEQMRPVYPLRGDHPSPEREIEALPGYRNSRPVRVGNGAETQVQMDVFGSIVALIADVAAAGGPVTDQRWWLVTQMAEAVSRRWNDPDFGIWEERRPTRQHVHSKVMCWQTIDRALKIAKYAGRTPDPSWVPLCEAIKAQVLAEGWNEDAGAYTIAYGDPGLDSAVLYLALSGMLDAHDPRFVATVEKIESSLRFGPTVYRYALDDGFRESEGGFLVCAAWLAQAYWMMGRVDAAAELFSAYQDLAGPTGLLSEQYEPFQQICLGNIPQAYSHIGLINMARAAESMKNLGPPPLGI